MHPTLLLLFYAALCGVASLSGGWVPLLVKLTHRKMQIAISFVSGIILGIGLLHMVPHSFHELGSIDRTMFWVMCGFLFMFFLERFFHFHHHDVSEADQLLDRDAARAQAAHHHEHSGSHGDAHAHDHSHQDHSQHGHTHTHANSAAPFAWWSAAIGLTLHSLVDGVAIAAALRAEDGNELVRWAGVGVFLAVVLHKPFDSLTIGTLMAAAGRSTLSRHLLNGLYALVTPLGMLLFYMLSAAPGQHTAGLGEALGFAGGAFICIATSDLLPELQFHRHDRLLLTASLVLGILLAWSTVLLEGEHAHDEPGGHEHGVHHHDESHEHSAHDHGEH